jgi:hypothetical protein
MLRSLQIFMPQHPAHCFNRHSVRQRHGRGESMPRRMEGHLLRDLTGIRDLL